MFQEHHLVDDAFEYYTQRGFTEELILNCSYTGTVFEPLDDCWSGSTKSARSKARVKPCAIKLSHVMQLRNYTDFNGATAGDFMISA